MVIHISGKYVLAIILALFAGGGIVWYVTRLRLEVVIPPRGLDDATTGRRMGEMPHGGGPKKPDDDPKKKSPEETGSEDNPPPGRKSFSSFISQVWSERIKVFTTTFYKTPLVNGIWKTLPPRDRVWTEGDGEAKLRFLSETCKTGFHLFRKSGYVRSNCSKEDLASGNNHCVEYGTVDVSEKGCGALAKVFTDGLQIDPTGTNFTVQYRPNEHLTMVAVTDGSVEVTPVLSQQPFSLSNAIPTPVGKGLCIINTISGAPKVRGVNTMTAVNGGQCAQFIDKETMIAIDADAKARGIKVTPPPLLPPLIGFGDQVVGLSVTQKIEYKNYGFLTATITDKPEVVGSGDFTFGSEGDCASKPIGGNEQCLLTVTFKPSIKDVRSGTLVIRDNTASGPHSIRLVGSGVEDVPMPDSVGYSPKTLGFGILEVGTPSEKQIATFTNTGKRPISFGKPTLGGEARDDFEVVSNTCAAEIKVGGQCYVALKFTPRFAQLREAQMSLPALRPTLPDGVSPSVQDNAAFQVSLIGRGILPNPGPGGVTLPPNSGYQNPPGSPVFKSDAPDSECFGIYTPVDAKGDKVRGETKKINVTNSGGGELKVDASLQGNTRDFKLTNNCAGTVVKPGLPCQITVGFTPKSSGSHQSTLVITSNDATRPRQQVKLTGGGKSRCWLFRQFGKMFGRYKKRC